MSKTVWKFMQWVSLAVVVVFGAGAASAQTRAYVTNFPDNAVSVIDTASNTVIATVPVGAGPSSIAGTPDGAFVYVANGVGNTVSVISTATNTVVATVPVGLGLAGIAITPDGRFAYVTAATAGTVDVIDTATNSVIATIPVAGTVPTGIAITPDGAFAYVVYSFFSRDVAVIDTATSSQVATIPTPGALHVAITPDGDFAYVSALDGPVYVIDTATNTVATTIPLTMATGAAITPNGAFVYVAQDIFATVAVIDTATNTQTATVGPFAGRVNRVAITPDGAFVYGTSGSNDEVYVIDTATNTHVATIPAGRTPIGIAIVSVPPPPPPGPTVTKAFNPTNIPFGQTSQLTITLTNPNAFAITGTAFTDEYPAGLRNAAVPNVTNSCGGTATALPAAETLTLTGGTIPASGSCTVSVFVTPGSSGSFVNTLPAGSVTSANASPSEGAASATLTTAGAATADVPLSPTAVMLLAVALSMAGALVLRR